MPIGIVSDSEFMLEYPNLPDNLKSEEIWIHPKILPNPPKIEEKKEVIIPEIVTRASFKTMPELGRGNTKEIPEVMRSIIGETALMETGKNTAELFGVSQSSVSAYKVGANSTSSYNQPDAELKKKMKQSRDRITSKAKNRLLLALDAITPDKLADIKVKDAALIAKDMSAIIRNIEPPSEVNNTNVQFVFFSPKQKSESDYEIIQVDN